MWRICQLDRPDEEGPRRVVFHWGSESRSAVAAEPRVAAGKIHVAHMGGGKGAGLLSDYARLIQPDLVQTHTHSSEEIFMKAYPHSDSVTAQGSDQPIRPSTSPLKAPMWADSADDA